MRGRRVPGGEQRQSNSFVQISDFPERQSQGRGQNLWMEGVSQIKTLAACLSMALGQACVSWIVRDCSELLGIAQDRRSRK